MSRTLTTLALLAASSLAISLAHAQEAVRDPKGIVSSWTSTAEEAFVKEEIRGAGYSGINSLFRDSDGTWHGRAYKGPGDVLVAVDRSGHVSEMSR